MVCPDLKLVVRGVVGRFTDVREYRQQEERTYG